jgi:protein TonB
MQTRLPVTVEKLSRWSMHRLVPLAQNRMLLSVILHGIVLFFVFNAWWFGAKMMKKAGSVHGSQVMFNYAAGKPAPHLEVQHHAAQPHHSTPRIAVSKALSAPDTPTSTATVEALGDGPASILFVQAFPSQRLTFSGVSPLSDLVVDVQIDEKGHVTEAHKRHGMSAGIDDAVVATVQQWIFHPAQKDGKAIPSVQELHFRFDARRNPSCGWECFQLVAD